MARKAPCECGHLHSWHAGGKWCMWPAASPYNDVDLADDCDAYVPAKRTEPLRAKRTPSSGSVEIHLHFHGGTELTKARLAQLAAEVRRAVPA